MDELMSYEFLYQIFGLGVYFIIKFTIISYNTTIAQLYTQKHMEHYFLTTMITSLQISQCRHHGTSIILSASMPRDLVHQLC